MDRYRITSEIYKNPFKYLYFFLLIFYIGMYVPYGLEDGDMGSIFGISWSMYNGYFPFKDFVYIKPPASPYFHSLFLYITEEYAYLINRAFYYVQVFMYSLLAAKLLFKVFKISSKNLVYFIAILGALVSIHNYPPMPWNTVDGVFFATIGLYFLFSEKKKILSIITAAFFISISVLCKQSFFFLPVFLFLYLLIFKEYRKLIYFIISGIFFALVFILILYLNNSWQPFFDQIFSFTPSSSLVDSGIKSYYLALKFNIIAIIIITTLFFILRKLFPGNPTYLFLNLTIAGIFIYYFLGEDSFYTVKSGLLQILFVVTAFFALLNFKKQKEYLFLLLLLSLSWCASISNGFKTPIHFSTPIVFGLFLLCYNFRDIKFSKKLGVFTVLLFTVTFYIGYQNIYMDSNRNKLTYNMGEVFPKLKFIKSDKETYEKYKELKTLSSKYDNFTILPSVTLGHYLTNTLNPIGVDWVFNHHLSNQLPAYIDKLNNKNITVFLENFEGHINNYEETSDLTMYVKEHWKMVEKSDYFRVYQKP